MLDLVAEKTNNLETRYLNNSESFNQTNQQKQSENLNLEQTELSKNPLSKASKNVNRYLLLITRLESGLAKGNINSKELNQILNDLSVKLTNLSPKDLKIIQKTPEYKAANLNLTSFNKQTLLKNLKLVDARQKLFDFLLSKPLIAILKGEPQELQIYQKAKPQISKNLTWGVINQKINPTPQQVFMRYRQNLKFSV